MSSAPGLWIPIPRPTEEDMNKLKQSVRIICIVTQKEEEQQKQAQTKTTDVKKDSTQPEK